MSIKHKGITLRSEERFDQKDIYGLGGAIANALFGRPWKSSVVVKPDEETVTIYASYGYYTIRKDEINTASTCRKLGLSYIL